MAENVGFEPTVCLLLPFYWETQTTNAERLIRVAEVCQVPSHLRISRIAPTRPGTLPRIFRHHIKHPAVVRAHLRERPGDDRTGTGNRSPRTEIRIQPGHT